MDISVLALPTLNLGYHNQILGAFRGLSDVTGCAYDEQAFLLPEDVVQTTEMKKSFFKSRHEKYKDLKQRLYPLLETYFQKNVKIPRVFVTVYDATDSKFSPENVDLVCRIVKEYYQENKQGDILTTILTSRLYNYKYVDLINVPKHMLTLATRIRLLQNKKLRRKVLITIGTLNNFKQSVVLQKQQEFLKKLKTTAKYSSVRQQCEKLEKYLSFSKKVVLCLGGRVDGSEIIFDIKYAKKLLEDARHLSRCGYGVVFVNGPRTPNDVVDFLYEKTQDEENIIFQNCKKIIKTGEEQDNWRAYSGKYEKQFTELSQLGNIYPAILGFDNTLVVHSMDSYAACETANAGFPTAVSGKGIYVDAVARYDCHNLKALLCPKYAIDWDDFVKMAKRKKTEPKDLKLKVLPNSLRVFAEAVMKRIS